MRKGVVILAGTSLAGAILAFQFWNQVRDDQRLIVELQQQLGQSQSARRADAASLAPGAVVMQPAAAPVSASVPLAPTAPTILSEALAPTNAPSQQQISGCESLRPQIKESSAELSARLKLRGSDAQRFAELRETQAIVSLPCSSAGSSTLSPEQVQVQMMALLGPARFEQLQEVMTERNLPVSVETFSAQLQKSGIPLNVEQSLLLTAAILKESPHSGRKDNVTARPTDPYERLAYEEENFKLTKDQNERILKAAQAYLRPEQLAQLRRNFTEGTNMMCSLLFHMRSSVEAGRGIPSTVPNLRTVPQCDKALE